MLSRPKLGLVRLYSLSPLPIIFQGWKRGGKEQAIHHVEGHLEAVAGKNLPFFFHFSLSWGLPPLSTHLMRTRGPRTSVIPPFINSTKASAGAATQITIPREPVTGKLRTLFSFLFLQSPHFSQNQDTRDSCESNLKYFLLQLSQCCFWNHLKSNHGVV